MASLHARVAKERLGIDETSLEMEEHVESELPMILVSVQLNCLLNVQASRKY